MNRYVFTALVVLFLLIPALGQEASESGFTDDFTNASAVFSAENILSISTVLILLVIILLIVLISARNYSNTNRELLEKALERNKEMPEELQEPVSTIIKAFPQAEPLGLPRGSLRAIVMLILAFAYVFLLLVPPKEAGEMVKTLETILAILIGFYFGSRYTEYRQSAAKKEVLVEEPGVKEVFKEITELPKGEEKKKKKRREELI